MQLLEHFIARHRRAKIVRREVVCAICENVCSEKVFAYCEACGKRTRTVSRQYCDYVTETALIRFYHDGNDWRCEPLTISFCRECYSTFIEPELRKINTLCRGPTPPTKPRRRVQLITATVLSRVLEKAVEAGLEVYGAHMWSEKYAEYGGLVDTLAYSYSYYIYDRKKRYIKDECVRADITALHLYCSLILRAKTLARTPFEHSMCLAEFAYWKYLSKSIHEMSPEEILQEVEQRDTEKVNKALRELLCA